MKKILQEIGIKRIFRYFIFSLWQWIFELLPFSPLRVFWLRLGGARIGKSCVIDKIDFVNLDRLGLGGLVIGDECFLGRGVLLDLAGEIKLDRKVTLSPRVIVLSHFSVGFSDHPLLKKYPKFVSKTYLEEGCFVGVGSIILPGLKIGSKSLVAAGSVVRKNVVAESLVAGVPAKLKKR